MPYWDMDRRLLVEKSPPNLVMGRFLQALFPGSALVVVVRHPVVVALSNKKWRKLLSRNAMRYGTLSALVGHWVRAHELLLDDAAHLKRLHVVRYEDLVEQPEQELGRIGSFLGLAQPIPASSLSGSRSERYEQAWRSMAGGVGPGAWQRRLIARRYARTVATFGYDINDLHVRGPWPVGTRA